MPAGGFGSDGPLSQGASVNYMTYPIDDDQRPNLNVITVVALEAGIVDGALELNEIALSRPCESWVDTGCIPNFTHGAFGPFRIEGGLAGQTVGNADPILMTQDPIWITRDGVSWSRLSIDIRESVVAPTASFPGETIYLFDEQGLWAFTG